MPSILPSTSVSNADVSVITQPKPSSSLVSTIANSLLIGLSFLSVLLQSLLFLKRCLGTLIKILQWLSIAVGIDSRILTLGLCPSLYILLKPLSAHPSYSSAMPLFHFL